jgi:hypothetical protein
MIIVLAPVRGPFDRSRTAMLRKIGRNLQSKKSEMFAKSSILRLFLKNWQLFSMDASVKWCLIWRPLEVNKEAAVFSLGRLNAAGHRLRR